MSFSSSIPDNVPPDNATTEGPASDHAIVERSAHDALVTAQEGIESVAKMLGAIDQSGKPSTSAVTGAIKELRPITDCLRDILNAPKRDQAVEVVVRRIAFEIPGCSVRAVLGRSEVTKVFDSRLGWLAAGNEVRQSMREPFESVRPASGTTLKHANRIRSVDRWQTLELTSESTPRRLVVFIQSKNASPENRQPNSGSSSPELTPSERVSGQLELPAWLTQSCDLLSAAVASRPVVALPRIVDVIGHRPMITVLATGMLVGLLALWPVHYPVTCVATIQPLHARLVASPFDATLKESLVQPGDEVKAGQVLLELDGRPLRLELESIEAEIQAAEKDGQVAMATGDIAGSQKAGLHRKKLSHRRNLLSDRLNELSIISPVDGIVIGGDLERYVGAPLSSGQSLMEIAPLDRVAIDVEIPDFEIGMIESTAATRVRLSAVGGASLRGNLDQVYPAAELRDDRNVFIGRMTIDNLDGMYRPGMKGDAMAYGPMRPLAWSYVRGFWEKVLWSVGY